VPLRLQAGEPDGDQQSQRGEDGEYDHPHPLPAAWPEDRELSPQSHIPFLPTHHEGCMKFDGCACISPYAAGFMAVACPTLRFRKGTITPPGSRDPHRDCRPRSNRQRQAPAELSDA
jgi:hypothetical protein